MLRNYSMIGHGLAHVTFAAIAVALLLKSSPLILSVPLVVASSFLILKINEKAQIDSDAAIGIVSSLSIAAGVLIASISGGFNVDLFSYLFGSILIISSTDLFISLALSLTVIFVVVFYYKRFFSITYDEEFAEVTGINTKKMNYIIAALTSITIVVGTRLAGTMLVSSLVIIPTVAALQIAGSFKGTILFASVFSLFSVFAGIFLAYGVNFPAGATIVLLNGGIFIATYLWRVIKR